MVSSLGHDFRHNARQGRDAAFVVTLQRDGSFKLVESRVISASGLAAAGIGVSVATLAGFTGIRSIFKGAKSGAEAAHARRSHVHVGADRARELLSEAGSSGAVLLIRTSDQATTGMVEARAADRASQHWRGSKVELFAALDRLGSDYDWLRPAAGNPPDKNR